MESKKNIMKTNILGALILTVSLIIIGISSSYAYFANAVVEENSGNKGAAITSGGMSMNFTSEVTGFSGNAISLVNDSDITSSSTAQNVAFSITLPTVGTSNNNVSNATYDIYLNVTSISVNLKSKYLKYRLYKGTNVVKEGTFENYTTSPITLATETIAAGNTNSYKLYIWLSNDSNAQQNSLESGSFAAKVTFAAKSATS